MANKNVEAMTIQIDLLNRQTGERFTKGYDTVREAQRFIYRVKYGKKLTILGVRSSSVQAVLELKI